MSAWNINSFFLLGEIFFRFFASKYILHYCFSVLSFQYLRDSAITPSNPPRVYPYKERIIALNKVFSWSLSIISNSLKLRLQLRQQPVQRMIMFNHGLSSLSEIYKHQQCPLKNSSVVMISDVIDRLIIVNVNKSLTWN